jgi:hypothetical protein
MEQGNNQKQVIENKEFNKIYIGMAIILLSPVLGSLLFYPYTGIVGQMISTNSAVDVFWFSCIIAVAILGMAMVVVGCNEKTIKDKSKISE